jgi:peptidoglycan/LPS O-acetylase OafA/YrhL
VRNRLKRITTSGIYIPEIDGLRFLAISSVVLFHLLMELHLRSGRVIPVENGWAWLDKFLSNGYRGVHLFFLISGMILAMPFARQLLRGERPVSLRKYYLRRVTRLEPPYLASILIAVLLIAVYNHSLHGISAGHVLATVFYQHNLIYGEASTINIVTWSLEIEIQFYLLAPLIMQIFRVRPAILRRAILAALIVAISAAQYFTHHSRQFELSILYYLQYFLAGLLLADLFTLELQSAPPRWWWDVAGVAALLIGFWIPGDELGHAVLPVVFGVLFVGVFKGPTLRRIFSMPSIAITGGMCYSIYLLHFLVIAVVFKISRYAIVARTTFFTNFAVQLVLVVPVVFLLSALFYLAIERPCMDPEWPRKLRQRLLGVPAASKTLDLIS